MPNRKGELPREKFQIIFGNPRVVVIGPIQEIPNEFWVITCRRIKFIADAPKVSRGNLFCFAVPDRIRPTSEVMTARVNLSLNAMV